MFFREIAKFNIGNTSVVRDFRIQSVRPYNLIAVKRMGVIGVLRFDIRNMNKVYETGIWSKKSEIPVALYLANKYKYKLFPELEIIKETLNEEDR